MAFHHWLGSYSVVTEYSCVGGEVQSMWTEKLLLESPDGVSTVDFDVATRVAVRLWGFNDAALSFAGSSVSTRVSFIRWKGRLAKE